MTSSSPTSTPSPAASLKSKRAPGGDAITAAHDDTSLGYANVDEKARVEGGGGGGDEESSSASAGDVKDQDGPATVSDRLRTRRILRRIDVRLLPICSLLYLFSFLDRSAIGNAKVSGMNTDLKLSASKYNLAVSIFFLLYCSLEVPSQICLKKLGAKTWLPIIVFTWGLIMTLSGLVQSGDGLVVSRVFLGAAESGLFPGVSVLLSFLYPRSYIQLRIGIFFSAATIAGAFGGALSYGLGKIEHSAWGREGRWRFIFIVEGAATCVAAILGFFFLFNGIDDAKFLSKDEKEYLRDRIEYDGTDVPMNNNFDWKFVRQGLKDWRIWFNTFFVYIPLYAPVYSIALTLPSILNTSLKYSTLDSQLLTVPVYCVAAVTVILFSFAADHFKNRTAFLLLGTAISAVGWAMNLASTDPHVGYAGMFLAAMGSYGAFPSVVALMSQNVGGQTKRAVALGIQVGIGGYCGVIAPNIFPASSAPRFELASKINIGLNAAAFFGALVNAALLTYANRRKQRAVDSGEAARLSRQELADLGDENPHFKYRL